MTAKKVFPKEKSHLTARQRADRQLSRSAGVCNGPDESTEAQRQMSMTPFDDDQSQVTIQSR